MRMKNPSEAIRLIMAEFFRTSANDDPHRMQKIAEVDVIYQKSRDAFIQQGGSIGVIYTEDPYTTQETSKIVLEPVSSNDGDKVVLYPADNTVNVIPAAPPAAIRDTEDDVPHNPRTQDIDSAEPDDSAGADPSVISLLLQKNGIVPVTLDAVSQMVKDTRAYVKQAQSSLDELLDLLNDAKTLSHDGVRTDASMPQRIQALIDKIVAANQDTGAVNDASRREGRAALVAQNQESLDKFAEDQIFLTTSMSRMLQMILTEILNTSKSPEELGQRLAEFSKMREIMAQEIRGV